MAVHRDHGHDHGHAHARTDSHRRLLLSLGITSLIFVAEVIGGLVSGSLALLSDAGHMLGDVGAQLLSLFALLLASRPADARRTFGYYRLEILAALANGVLLLGLAAFIGIEAYHRLSAPPEIQTELMMAVAAVGLAANLVSGWLLHGSGQLNVKSAYLHVVSDALSSAAVLIGGAIMWARGGAWLLDPILGFVISIVIVAGAFRLLREVVEVLLEAVPRGIDLQAVREDVNALDGVEDVHDLHIWTLTSGHYALSAHLVVKGDSDQARNDAILRSVGALLLDRHRIGHSTLQIESTECAHGRCD